MGQFAYGGPAPVVVSAVSPTSGKVGTPVTISGSGFVDGATVHFKDKASDSVKFVPTGPDHRNRARSARRPPDGEHHRDGRQGHLSPQPGRRVHLHRTVACARTRDRRRTVRPAASRSWSCAARPSNCRARPGVWNPGETGAGMSRGTDVPDAEAAEGGRHSRRLL
ncbi:IPT/TIG domain-containing protein [Kitasatospora sp. NPDC001159]